VNSAGPRRASRTRGAVLAVAMALVLTQSAEYPGCPVIDPPAQPSDRCATEPAPSPVDEAPAPSVPAPAEGVVPGSLSGFFVAPGGDDGGPGTEERPWGSLARSLGRLGAGDTLWVRGGRYFERGVEIGGLEGSAQQPIRVRAYPGETPVVDGGYPEFRSIGNRDWEVVDGSRHVYRSVKRYPDASVHGKFEHEGELYALASYRSLASLMSDDIFYDQDPSYAGPGIFYNSGDGRIYVRLVPVDPSVLDGRVFDFPTELDPRQTRIFIGPTGSGAERQGLVNSKGKTSHVVFDGIDLHFHEWSVRLHGPVHDVEFRNATWIPLKIGAVTGSRVDGLVLHGLDIVLGFPQWLSWSEIKTNDAGVLREQKLAGVAGQGGGSKNIEVRYSRFDRAFDAMVGFSGDSHIYVHHNDMITYDDALQLRESASFVEFAYNRVDGPGISHYGPTTNVNPGSVFVHHNIIDATRPILMKRRTSDGSIRSEPLRVVPTHGGTQEGNPWKIYNNTLIGASKSSTGIEGAGKNDTGVPHEVYNNIIVSDDRWVTRNMRVDRKDIYDGNAYWWRPTKSSSSTFFFDVRNGDARQSYASLAKFKSSAWASHTRSYYPPGWEASGIDNRDPKLDERYIPGDTTLWSGGVDLTRSRLPGINGTYRGAIRPGDNPPPVGPQR
jgi:hypothetical protein